MSDLNSYKEKFKFNAAAAGLFGVIALHQILTAFPAGRLFLVNMSFGDLSVEDALSNDVNREKVCETIVRSHKTKTNILNGIYNSIECVTLMKYHQKMSA
ncbi:MAG: hypothetical protein ACXVCY_09645 [Pseudobdellovibrionaceae bacterium]